MHPFSLRLSQASTNLTYSKSSKVHTSKPSVHLENSNKENVPDAANIDRHNKKEEPTKRSSKYEASPGIDRRSPTNPLQSHNRNYNAMSTHLNNKLVLTSPKAGEVGPVKKESENNRILLKSLDNFLENKENRANNNIKESKAVKPGAKRVKEESTYSTKTREDQSTTRDTNSRLLSLAEDTAPEEMTIYTRLLTTTKPLTSKNKDSFMHNLEHNYYSPQHNMQKASMDLLAMTNQARRAYLNGPTIDGRLHEHENHTKEDKGSSSDFQKLLKVRTKLEQNHSKDKTTTTPKISQNEKNERYRHTQENFAQEKPKTRYPSTKKLSIDIQEPINIKERGSSKTDKDLMPNSSSYSKSKLAQSYTSLKKEMDSRGLLQKSPTLVEGDGSKYRTSLRDSSEVKVPFKLTSPKAESYEAIEMRRSMRSPKNFDKENNMPQSHSKNSGGQRGYYGSFVETDKEAEHNKAKEKLMGSYSQKKRPLSLVQNMHENETYGSSKKKEETRVLISPKQEKVNAPSLKDFVTQVNIGSGTLVSTPSEGRDSFSQQKRFDTISNKSTPKTQDLSEDSYFAHISKKHNKEKPPKAPQGRKDADLMWEKKTVPTKKITFRTEEDDHRSVARRTEAIAESKERSTDSSVYYMSSLEKYLRGTDVEEDYFQKIYKEHFFQGFQAINFCRYMKPVDMGELERKKVYLPRRDTHKDKKTLIFDLDETLIHCNEDPTMPCDAVIAIQFPHGDTIEAGINIRPYAMECLMELNKYYEIIVFTASHSCYANVALDYLDPEEKYIHHRLFRDHCMTTPEGLYIKDLRILANRDPKDVIIVDNAVYSFGFQLENGIPIIPFYFNKHDVELKSLTSYLKKLAHVPDVREMNKKVFKLHSYAGSESAEEVLTKLLNK